MILSSVDDSVQCTAIVTPRPQLEQIADVDNKCVFAYWNGNPSFCRWVPDLKPARSWFL